jgi:predicted short-subunit dehydrogenase-like oxidoreductase (DUF2520 family)
MTTTTRLPRTAAVLGGGAVGGVLLPALRTIGVRVVAAWTRSPKTPQWRGGALPRGLREAELIILSVTDASVGPLCAQLVAERLLGPGQIVAHLAGALDLTPLAPALAAGAKVGSMHPLRAVPPGSRADALSGAAAGIEGSDDEVRGMLHALAQALHMLPLAAAGSRALYHAAAVLAGGAQVALFSEAVRAFQSATGASEPEARAALLPLTKGAIETLSSQDPAQAITGPVTRGDVATVSGHLKALDSHDARTAQIYRQLSQAASELAKRGSRTSAAKLAPINAALAPGADALPSAVPTEPKKTAPAAEPKKPAPAAGPKRPALTLVKNEPALKVVVKDVPAGEKVRTPSLSAVPPTRSAPATKSAPAKKPAPIAKAPAKKAAAMKAAPQKAVKKTAAKAKPAAKKKPLAKAKPAARKSAAKKSSAKGKPSAKRAASKSKR